ncbi:MAG: hypothetical protein ACKVHL_12065, partial [Rhodospirillales bacterium]
SQELLQAFQSAGSIPDATLNLGKVRYDISSGRLTFNGKPLEGDQQAELAAKCRELFKKGR